MVDENNKVDEVKSDERVCENESTKITSNSGNCKCGEKCPCKERKSCKCKNCFPIFLSAVACIVSTMALLKTCNKPCTSVKPIQTTVVDDANVRSTIIDVIKNDPQMLIDAMSAGIAKQRSDMTKQQAVEVNKYKDEIINASYTVGNKDATTVILCFFDPLCGGCIEFQKIMTKALKDKKSVCFHLIPVAVLGSKSEELAKIYYKVASKDYDKLTSFIGEIVKEPSDIDLALKNVSLNNADLNAFENLANEKMASNLALFEKIRATAVPVMFIKSESGNFTAVEEDELMERLK